MKRRYLIGIFLFILSFGLYLRTLCPTVYWRDSGELITVCYTLGIAHPAGYPLYTLLGRIFTLIPIGSIAYRVNLMSALFSSLTVLLIYLIVLRIQNTDKQTGRRVDRQTGRPFARHIPAIVASLLFALSPCFWAQATIAEADALNAFFLASLILILLKWREDREGHWLFLFSFLYGLSLGNHITILLFAPAFIVFIILTDYRTLRLKRISLMLCLFLLGAMIYLYLPLRSLQNPILDWGDPENLRNLLFHISGRQYVARLFDLPPFLIPHQMKKYLTMLISQFTLLPFLLAFLSLRNLRRDKKVLLLLFLLFLINVIFNTASRTLDIPHLYIPSFLVFSLLIGWGMRNLIFLSTKKGLSYLLCGLFLLLPLLLGIKRYPSQNKSNHYSAHTYGMNILNSIEKEGLFFPKSDNAVFLLLYLKYVEGEGPGVGIIDQNKLPYFNYFSRARDLYPYLKIPSQAKINLRVEDALQKMKGLEDDENLAILATISEAIIFDGQGRVKDYPIYWELMGKEGIIFDHLLPHGLLYRVEKEEVGIPTEEMLLVHKRLMESYRSQIRNSGKDFYLDEHACYAWARVHYCLGTYYMKKGLERKALEEYQRSLSLEPHRPSAHYKLGNYYFRKRDMNRAMREYERALASDPFLARAHYSLGLCYEKKGDLRRAEEAYKKALILDPRCSKAHNNLGMLYYRRGLYDEALEEFKEALRINPHYAGAYCNLGIIYKRKGRYEEAMTQYKRAIAADSRLALPHYNLGLLYAQEKRPEEAIREYYQALSLLPKEDYRIHLSLAQAYQEIREKEKALQQWEEAHRILNEALKRDPNNSQYLKAKDEVRAHLKRFLKKSEIFRGL